MVEPEIVPEPSPQERAALLAALAELPERGGPPSAYASPWRRAGLEADDDSGQS